MAEKKDIQQEKKSFTAQREEAVLAFWQKNSIFEKSLEKKSPKGEFVFYDGPPFATGLPHYGHLLAGTIKDVIPRFRTMQGYHVPRRWGWDCHGLPLENLVEKELQLQSKKDIQEHGVEKFVETAKSYVLTYADDWKRIVPRTGRWVDMENDYRTMDTTYSESVWWAFKTLYEKELIYKDFKSMHLCPRCETTLSNFEVGQGYMDVKDFAVTVGLPLVDDPKTQLLIWTTTPWTLPGNVAAAVHPDLTYVRVIKDEITYIIAEDRVQAVFGEEGYTLGATLKGSELVGLSYVPPFGYYQQADVEHKENAWQVYAADYVTAEDGTGIVHLAPAFGAEDMELARKNDLPLIHHVSVTGQFVDAVTDFAGMHVKQKGDTMSADIEIIKHLAHAGRLFAKEKIEHSYPHCWRCDTPLLNYAASSWFVKVAAIKDDIIKENKKAAWVPDHIGHNRFHKLLEGAPDWAISRSRYWGAPLPVWECDSCDKRFIAGSVDELKERVTPSGNTYFVMRHGESEGNKTYAVSLEGHAGDVLTDKGKGQVQALCKRVRPGDFDLIITSPLKRTHDSAKIVAEHLDFDSEQLIVDERIREFDPGSRFHGSTWKEYHEALTLEEQFHTTVADGENRMDLKRRVGNFLYEIDTEYADKRILLVTHEGIADALIMASEAAPTDRSREISSDNYLNNAELRPLEMHRLPHNADFELDLHRPYIDDVGVTCECGAPMVRVEDVFDCWFESGSMPFAQHHHPFDNKDVFWPKKKHGFPADFIAEGVDQTRGWFYSLLVLGTALFGHIPYKNVIVNGTVLAEDGQKMSKKLQNYPDPMLVVDKYGADALRYYLLSSSVVRSEDFNFSEQGVDEVVKKVIVRLGNVLSFYQLYADDTVVADGRSAHPLDQWIITRLNELIRDVTEYLEGYELDRATRPIGAFIEDLSVWYIRRSRDRFKGDDADDKAVALATTKYVLTTLAQVIAPAMPFFADHLYRELGGDTESVHLEDWPKASKVDQKLLDEMATVREVISLALEQRATVGIKVRQPLASLTITTKIPEEYYFLIQDEVNVKEVIYDPELVEKIRLDSQITPELQEEGNVRELVRHIQSLRKKAKLTPSDQATLTVGTDEAGKAFIEKHIEELTTTTLLKDVVFADADDDSVRIDTFSFTLTIAK